MFDKGQKNYSSNVYHITQKDDNGFIAENNNQEDKRILPFQIKKINKDQLISKEKPEKGVKKNLKK